MSLARITTHPTDPAVICLHTPPELADQMGRFAPARYSPPLRGYLVHRDHLDALTRFATTIGMHLTDEQTKPPHARPDPLPECHHCGQPAQGEPQRCAGCGQQWQPVVIRSATAGHDTARCASCHQDQAGRFPYCGRCGAQMPPPRQRKVPVLPRPKSPDPVPLADTFGDVEAALNGKADA